MTDKHPDDPRPTPGRRFIRYVAEFEVDFVDPVQAASSELMTTSEGELAHPTVDSAVDDAVTRAVAQGLMTLTANGANSLSLTVHRRYFDDEKNWWPKQTLASMPARNNDGSWGPMPDIVDD